MAESKATNAKLVAPSGYTVVKGAGAVKLAGFRLPEAKPRRLFPVSKPPSRKGRTTNMQHKQYAIALDRPAYNQATKRSLTRSR